MGSSPLSNPAAPGLPYYTPAQNPPAGSALDPSSAPTLFQPLQIRGTTLHNRFVVSPMCQYSSQDGILSDYHLVHLGQFAKAGAALTIVEATAVEARGRISPQDAGLWSDEHVAPLKRIVEFIHSQGTKAGIQLSHAGRKASVLAPWISEGHGKSLATSEFGGWPDDTVSSSAIPFASNYATPRELSVAEIQSVVQAFADAASRAVTAGFDTIELHAAHGYLLNQFLSPLSNTRTDDYGGNFDNRTRLLREVISAVRAVIPESMPLWVRISATEWMEWDGKPTWDIEESIRLARTLPGLGVDLLDVSSGGNNSSQKIEISKHYQADLAGKIRQVVQDEGIKLLIGAVGFISEAEMARDLCQEGGDTAVASEEKGIPKADVVIVAREFLRDPHFVLHSAQELHVPVKWPNQYHRAPRRTH
ncbi:unnamed protein product [Clonostachys chloroleuca]|uniref:NADH:flavin oxidoreductase/NADH oxidase N-terminal domain-containing protein n=1 Tax=Clonostachys chloroleuca TaxID=1926264 RepID=A0AA35VBM4_9HYPO|nr:unnamed protein product [Clonostachys chloroleuca]